MGTRRVVIIGAGVGGLSAAVALAARGVCVTLVERSAQPGGKMRDIEIAGTHLDVGPTVLTMRSVFEEIFAAAGASLSDHVLLRPASILARHAWSEDERLDLFADRERSADAIGQFAGRREAQGYRDFCARAQRIFESLQRPFIYSPRPSLDALVAAFGLRRLGELWQISPFVSLWRALGDHFQDPRLRQLFARYATYCGASPFMAPATLMLVAHVEQAGVWLVEGGMHRLAQALAGLAVRTGATVRYLSEVRGITVAAGRAAGVTLKTGEQIDADAVIVNADTAAISSGWLGRAVAAAVPAAPPAARSLSAITWAMVAPTSGFPLLRHNVFFSRDYAAEFERMRCGKLPAEPTVYVCAQARTDIVAATSAQPEALFCLVNAPARSDVASLEPLEITQCEERTFARLERCGLRIQRRRDHTVVTTPRDFDQLYPGTGGALYGPAPHGWMASFRRPGSRCRMPGLYLVGGSTHPGPGVPMAAISGRLAAEALLSDLASTGRSLPAATSGGISTR
jgi:1-hydroxycarotenoid 3,4-desaturase